MLTVFPFYAGDVDRMIELLEWIRDLGGCKAHEALLVADAGVEFQRCLDVKTLAAKSFRSVELISNEVSVIGWVEGPKSLFLTAGARAQQRSQPFLQMETDAIPLRTDWLDLIDRAYSTLPGHAMGHIYPCEQPNFPRRILSGIGVFPAEVIRIAQFQLVAGENWDISVSKSLVGSLAIHTPLIHHLWGEPDLPPTFVDRKTNASPKNAFTLADIPKEAVIWHRNKDGTLINLLRKKLLCCA